MAYWAWLLLGVALLAIELATPGGFFAFFFGVSGLVVGVLVALGWAGPAWMQWLLFSVLSIVALAALRKPVQSWLAVKHRAQPVDSIPGESALALEDIAVGAIGRAELRGTSWSAKNGGAGAIVKGQRLRVDRIEGLMLHVHTE
jgi:membrane protein implicated in regulation of membrane protease activity